MPSPPLTNNFDGGSDGATITTSDATSGDAWSVVTGTPTWDNDHVRDVLAGAAIQTGVYARKSAEWTGLGSLTSNVYFRCYVWLDTITTNFAVMQVRASGGGACAQLLLRSDDTMESLNAAAGAISPAGTEIMAFGEWMRIEWRVLPSTTNGETEIRWYLGDSVTPEETLASASTAVLAANIDQVRFGMTGTTGSAASTVWFDDAAVSTTGWIGPSGTARTGRHYKRFVGPVQLSSTPETLYTVPDNGRSVIRNIYANNPSGAAAALTLGIALPDAYADEVLSDSPVAYYRMDEASGQPQDSSGNGLHTTGTSGSPTYSQAGAIAGDADTAISFTTAQNFYRGDNALLDLTDTCTLEAWVKRSATGATHGIVGKSTGAYYMRLASDNTLQLLASEVAVIVSSTTTITDTTTWHHVVATKSGATVKLYIDGVDVTGTVTNTTLVNNSFDLYLNADTGAEMGAQTLDEVALYPTALSAARILAHYEAAQPADGIFDEDTVPAGDILFARRDTNYVLEAGEVLQGFATTDYAAEVQADSPGGYWSLEEASGTVLDESANSNTGTVSGTITRQTAGLITTGYCYDHATSGIVTVAHHSTLVPPSTACSVECWVQFDTLPASDGDAGNITFYAKAPYWMRLMRVAGVTYFHMYWLNDVGGGTWAGLLSTTPITTGVTYYLASTYSGTTARLYLDGVQEAIDTGFTALRVDGTGDLTMGSSVFDGRLDEPAMYPTTLSAERILAHYDAGAGVAPVLVVDGVEYGL